jgi:hypothetical protein
MRRLSVFATALAVALASVAAVHAAWSPRDPRERLTPADQRLAYAAVLRRSDLVAAWRKVPDPYTGKRTNSCGGFNPDLTAFTVSGQADSYFTNGMGGAIMSAVDVFATRRDARSVFRTTAKPALMRCFTEGSNDSSDSRITSTRVASERVPGAERATGYRLQGWMQGRAGRLTMHMHAVLFLKGRSIGVLFVSTAGAPLSDRLELAGLVARRMR